eukprot:CAMPEP_0198561914 /NCGR_PEP_ID=MMETSP1462-20131121/96261_1 /TAXON_ID=1333877 /ORGANISM="Brandtodinium nutriculum, Strain RCC3387" /LENGTH=66 /DNA_ID=CAMNT_0044292827 /DNA_START=98 /DNA_END=295 /DNA_ORIENTATION=-
MKSETLVHLFWNARWHSAPQQTNTWPLRQVHTEMASASCFTVALQDVHFAGQVLVDMPSAAQESAR